jgi:hypothetical protein
MDISCFKPLSSFSGLYEFLIPRKQLPLVSRSIQQNEIPELRRQLLHDMFVYQTTQEPMLSEKRYQAVIYPFEGKLIGASQKEYHYLESNITNKLKAYEDQLYPETFETEDLREILTHLAIKETLEHFDKTPESLEPIVVPHVRPDLN